MLIWVSGRSNLFFFQKIMLTNALRDFSETNVTNNQLLLEIRDHRVSSKTR